MRSRILAGVVVLTALCAASQAQSPQAQAELAQSKLDTVMQGAPAGRAAGRRTMFSQAEMNAYLKYRAHAWLPAGITDPSLGFVDVNKVVTMLTADLDGVRKKSSGGWFDPTAYMSGRVPVQVIGTLTTNRGMGKFDLESATVDGIPVPRVFIQQLLAFYTRSADAPDGVRLDEPFVLPSEIDRIDVRPGHATVVQ
jgi:hypothetical protein